MTKVGISESPEDRVRDLSSLSGLDIDLIYVTGRLKYAAQIESFAHRILHPHRKATGYYLACDTEWFNVTPAVAKAAVREAVGLARACKRMRELGLALGQWSWE